MQFANRGSSRLTSRRPHRRSGFMLVATSLSLFFLLGVAGLAVDVGRMYITKSEAQAFADSAALSAASKLDGTSTGITNATSAATADSDKWRFDTSRFNTVGVSFSTSSTGSFVASPVSPSAYKFVQVYVSVNLPMYLIRIFSGATATVSASAVAGPSSFTTLPSGVFPFSPYARLRLYGGSPDTGSAGDPYGFTVGNQYTMRWGSPGDQSNCGSDSTSTVSGPGNRPDSSIRGYCCAGTSASAIGAAIVGLKTYSVTIGSDVGMAGGAKDSDIINYLTERSGYDTDNSSTTYTSYTGNGARIVVMPINDDNYLGTGSFNVVGFGSFLLLPGSAYNNLHGNDSACAIYLGQYVEGGQPGGTGTYGGKKLRLYQ